MQWHEAVRTIYRTHRYMDRLSYDLFVDRFNDVFKNILVISDDGKISLPPVDSEIGIYWMTMWTHVLEESEIRGNGISGFNSKYVGEITPFLNKLNIKVIQEYRIKTQNQHFLFKYGKYDKLEKLYKEGEIFLRAASFYSDPSLNNAIRDKELEREYYIDHEKAIKLKQVFQIPNNELHNYNNGKYRKLMKSDYYVYCLSNKFDPRLFLDFDADACLIIMNPDRFLSRLNDKRILKLEYSYKSGVVKYYDPILDSPHAGSVAFTKHFGYSYQNEFRSVFIPEKDNPKLQDQKINIDNSNIKYELVSIN